MFQELVDPSSDPEVAALVREFAGERWGRVSALYGMLLHQPDIARAWLELGSAIRKRSSLDDRIRELTICLVGLVAEQSFEIEKHVPLALAAGATQQELDALLDRDACPSFDERDLALLDLAEHIARSTVTEDAFRAAAARFDPAVLVEIATTVGYYVGTAHFLDAFGISAGAPGVSVPEGSEPQGPEPEVP